jgi:hypothetical protein
MKKIGLLLIVLLLLNAKSYSQTSRIIGYSGIYMTLQDYEEGKLSFEANCDSSSRKIKLHHFFSGKYVDIIRNDKKYRLSKDSIFGYRDCKGYDYRFYENYDHEYQIEEAKSIVIYSVLMADPTYTGKGVKLVRTYFFSKTINSAIMPLTVRNLKQIFPRNAMFCNLLDTDEDVITYDTIHKMYKVNYLMSLSI